MSEAFFDTIRSVLNESLTREPTADVRKQLTPSVEGKPTDVPLGIGQSQTTTQNVLRKNMSGTDVNVQESKNSQGHPVSKKAKKQLQDWWKNHSSKPIKQNEDVEDVEQIDEGAGFHHFYNLNDFKTHAKNHGLHVSYSYNGLHHYTAHTKPSTKNNVVNGKIVGHYEPHIGYGVISNKSIDRLTKEDVESLQEAPGSNYHKALQQTTHEIIGQPHVENHKIKNVQTAVGHHARSKNITHYGTHEHEGRIYDAEKSAHTGKWHLTGHFEDLPIVRYEEVESLDELSKKTLGNYVGKAAASTEPMLNDLSSQHKLQNRQHGINKAIQKISKIKEEFTLLQRIRLALNENYTVGQTRHGTVTHHDDHYVHIQADHVPGHDNFLKHITIEKHRYQGNVPAVGSKVKFAYHSSPTYGLYMPVHEEVNELVHESKVYPKEWAKLKKADSKSNEYKVGDRVKMVSEPGPDERKGEIHSGVVHKIYSKNHNTYPGEHVIKHDDGGHLEHYTTSHMIHEKTVNEEVEQIDELSKKTLKSYTQKAALSSYILDKTPGAYQKLKRRSRMIDIAHQKREAKKANEEVEQVNELSTRLLKRYGAKATKSYEKEGAKWHASGHKDTTAKHKMMNRSAGLDRAADRVDSRGHQW